MRKLLVIGGALVVLAGAGYLGRGTLMAFAAERMTENMFVAEDSDDFDPGVAVGEAFPPIKAMLAGRVVSDIAEFMGDKGLVVMMNRSVDW